MIGKTAENFILHDQHGNDFELYKNLDSDLLLVFYPKDDTPTCSRQLSDYSLNLKIFSEKGIKLAAVNSGSVKSHKNFCKHINAVIPVLSDEEKRVCKNFNALNFLGMIKRKLVLIGTDKKIKYERSTNPFSYITPKEIVKEIS